MPRPVLIYAYFLPRIFLEALGGSEACMPVAPIQRSGLNCHCPLAGAILMVCCIAKKMRHSVRSGFKACFMGNPGRIAIRDGRFAASSEGRFSPRHAVP